MTYENAEIDAQHYIYLFNEMHAYYSSNNNNNGQDLDYVSKINFR